MTEKDKIIHPMSTTLRTRRLIYTLGGSHQGSGRNSRDGPLNGLNPPGGF